MDRFVVSTLCLAALTGCAITRPSGWPYDSQGRAILEAPRSLLVQPDEPGVGLGRPSTPFTWDLPNGRRAEFDVIEGHELVWGPGFASALAAVQGALLVFDLTSEGTRLRCSTQMVAPGEAVERFGCQSMDETDALTFRVLAARDCPAAPLALAAERRVESCWNGVLDYRGARYELRWGHASAGVVGFVSWVKPGGELVLAAKLDDSYLLTYEPELSRDKPDELHVFHLLTLAASLWFSMRVS